MKKFLIISLCGMLSACHSLLFYWKNPVADRVSVNYILNYEFYIKKYGFDKFQQMQHPNYLDIVQPSYKKDEKNNCYIVHPNKEYNYPFKEYMQEIFSDLHKTNLHIKLNQEKILLSDHIEWNYMGGVRRLLDENKLKLIWVTENEACISTPVRLGHLLP